MKYTIYCDGLAEPNPGGGSWGFVVFDEYNNKVIEQKGFVGWKQTNNEMEYRAVIEALVWCHEFENAEITIYTDSQLVVNQLNGAWQVHSPNLQGWFDNANDLFHRDTTTIAWVRGTENKADELTRLAYEEESGLYPMPRQKGQAKASMVKR